jgi:hypothetical protein
LFQGLCSFPAVVNWLKQRQQRSGPLEFGVDVNAARYKDGVRETPNGEVRQAILLVPGTYQAIGAPNTSSSTTNSNSNESMQIRGLDGKAAGCGILGHGSSASTSGVLPLLLFQQCEHHYL